MADVAAQAPEPAADHPRGYVGWVYEDVFKDLYKASPQPEPQEPTEDAVEESTVDEGLPVPAATIDNSEINTSLEDSEIAAIQSGVVADQARIAEVLGYLKEKRAEAFALDRQDAEYLQTRWGLTMREQVPVAESKIRSLLDGKQMMKEGLIVPRQMMTEIERRVDINKGTVPQHDNLLAISKPDEPNYFKETSSLKLRHQARKVEPHLSEDQRAVLGEQLAEHRRQKPRMPPQLSAEERAKNREIVNRMQMKVCFLKNPRFEVDQAKNKGCPFSYNPDNVTFREYEVGGIYEIGVEFRNITNVGRRLRVLPCPNPAFSVSPLKYEESRGGDQYSIVAPGMAARLTVRFAPSSLNDEIESLVIGTELGDFALPLHASRVQPDLRLQELVDCGCILVGDTISQEMHVSNKGGEGSFRIVAAPSKSKIPSVEGDSTDQEAYYETAADGTTTLISGPFRICPASFYLEAGQSIEMQAKFNATQVGRHECPLLVEWDNGKSTPLTLSAITDAIRLELVRWPTRPEPVESQMPSPGVSPWTLMPWQLNWLDPGTQVGCTETQQLTISNGGYLPQEVEWRIALPPKELLSRLAVGSQPRLTEDILSEIHTWPAWRPSEFNTPACPFKVEPHAAVLAPHSTADFSFSFKAFTPAGRRSTAFAFIQAKGVPASGSCLLHFAKLVELQNTMQPEGYRKGLPLFGGTVSEEPVDEQTASERKQEELLTGKKAQKRGSCALSALCLQGFSVMPTVTVTPQVVAFAGDVLPFLTHTRELTLKNTGRLPACFRARLSSNSKNLSADNIDPLWVLGPREASAVQVDEGGEKAAFASLASQWPPLPPEGGNLVSEPGYGALASLTVEPYQGILQPGEKIVIKVTIRALRETDLTGHLMIDLPVSLSSDELGGAGVKVGVFAAVRSPRVEFRGASYLDYGVVRAHSRASMKACLANNSDLPLLVKLEQNREAPNKHVGSSAAGREITRFPFFNHSEVFDFFMESFGKTGADRFVALPSEDIPESQVEPWVHSQSGCLDKSGRRRYVFQGRRPIMEGDDCDGIGFLDDEEDFVFRPSCLVIWPRSTAEVEVILRTREVMKYRSLVEAVGFDSNHSACLEAMAEVQLPRLRLSTHHAHFPISYLRTASQPLEIELRNDSDMPATFNWDVPVRLEACVEVQIKPSQGQIQPRGTKSVMLVAVPTQETTKAELSCRVFVDHVLQPLEVTVTAKVFGLEVDYAVCRPDELPPEMKHEPRCISGESSGTYPVECGRAPRKNPILDFGEMELQRSKVMHLVLYNRTAIATPFAVKVERNAAYDPVTKGRKIGDLLDAATRMYSLCVAEDHKNGNDEQHQENEKQTFVSSPQPAGRGRKSSKEREDHQGDTMKRPAAGTNFAPNARKSVTSGLNSTKRSTSKSRKQKKLLLDNIHEKQVFRSSMGAEFAKKQELREQGSVALKTGRGWAIKAEPSSDWLQPFARTVIKLTCFSDLPGLMEDELVVNIRQLQAHIENKDFRIPIRLLSYGNPLFLPEQQVGLNLTNDPPRLLCGTIVPVEKMMTRKFKVGNNSSAELQLTWQVYPKLQTETAPAERQLVNVALRGKQGSTSPWEISEEPADEDFEEPEENPFDFKVWATEPPDVEDPFATALGGECPLQIDPPEVILPVHGTATFVVTMKCSKATTQAGGFYRYTLLGKGRFKKDRLATLAAAEAAEKGEAAQAEVAVTHKAPAGDAEVAMLPEMKLREEDLHSDDSDLEPVVYKKKATPNEASEFDGTSAAEAVVQTSRMGSKTSPEPDQDVISTIVVECVGDCILPRLVVDKKANPAIEDFPKKVEGSWEVQHVPVFKFTHSALPPPAALPEKSRVSGMTLGGLPGGSQIPGVALCLVRQITLSNETDSNISCRFRTDGPFRIRQICQVDRHPVQLVVDSGASTKKKSSKNPETTIDPDPRKHPCLVAKWETVTIEVEFVPEMVPSKGWSEARAEHVFDGDLVVEYPREAENSEPEDADWQRIHLVATSRRPAVRVTPIPNAALDRPLRIERADQPPWGEAQLVVVEFGYVHVESAVTRKREVLISNVSSIVAKWQLLHVGRKRRPPNDIGSTLREEEEFRALDDKDCFEFSECAGELLGPSKDGLVPGSEIRMPRCCPVTPALPKALPHADEHRYEPQRIMISFKPKKNELYRCKFRIQVESGLSFDFICRGCGSYDEEDDPVDIHEA